MSIGEYFIEPQEPPFKIIPGPLCYLRVSSSLVGHFSQHSESLCAFASKGCLMIIIIFCRHDSILTQGWRDKQQRATDGRAEVDPVSWTPICLARVETVQDRLESGSVVGDLLEAGKTHERGVVGETPNLAARLQGIAQPNTVIIGESTRAKTRTETLQSEAGYVDARPHQPELTKPIAPHGRTIHWVKNAAEIRSALDLLEAQEQFDPPDLSSRLKRIPGREGREFQISDIGAET